MLAKPTLRSLAQNGTSPERITSRLRSRALGSKRTIGSGSVGAAFQLGGKFGVGVRRDREDELDLADIGGQPDAATHDAKTKARKGDVARAPKQAVADGGSY